MRKRPTKHSANLANLTLISISTINWSNDQKWGMIWMEMTFLLLGAQNSLRPQGVKTIKHVLSKFDMKNLGDGKACLPIAWMPLPDSPGLHKFPQSENPLSIDHLDNAWVLVQKPLNAFFLSYVQCTTAVQYGGCSPLHIFCVQCQSWLHF